MKNANSNTSFQLSRIHRLLRPLKSSISSLKTQLDHQLNKTRTTTNINNNNNNNNHHHHHINRFYSEPKSNKRSLEENQEFKLRRNNQKKYKRSNNTKKKPQTNSHINPIISSPIFNSTFNDTHTTHRNRNSQPSSQDHQLIELETQIKIDKLILAYKNILDAVYSQTISAQDHQVSKLSTICARLIGRFIERAIELETSTTEHLSGNNRDTQQQEEDGESDPPPISLLTDVDWKTSVMDEWYDAIPLLYRRYALAQHALTMILRAFPIHNQSKPSPPKRNGNLNRTNQGITTYPQKLIQDIHSLHRNYSNPLIQSQALSILPRLFSLPIRNWYEIYDDYQYKFALLDRYLDGFMQVQEGRTFLEICSDREMVGFIDLTVDRLGAWAIDSWLSQRESLIHSRARWRQGREARLAGLESSDSEEAGMEDEVVIEYDRQSSSVILKWIHSLVTACLPNSIHCSPARRQLNAISRLLFDSLMTQSSGKQCSWADNYFLALLSITIESHRLTLFGLPMFNTGSVERAAGTDEEGRAAGGAGGEEKWSSGHAPMRLQALIAQLGEGEEEGGSKLKIFNKAAKLFFRAHRSTRLLAVLPGLLSSPDDRALIPGLDELFRSVIEGSYALERLAKSWVECLLQSDPASWWLVQADDSHPPNDDDLTQDVDDHHPHRSHSVVNQVRLWLENWLALVDDAHKLRLIDDYPDRAHHQEEEEGEGEEEEQQEEKPNLSCTCPPTLILPGEEDEKPETEKEGERRPAVTHHQQVRVVVPIQQTPHPARRRKKRSRSSRLSLPPSRRKLKALPLAPDPCSRTSGSIDNRTLASSSSSSVMLTRMRPNAIRSRDKHLSLQSSHSLPQTHNHVQDQSHHNTDDDDDDFDAMDLLALPSRSPSIFTSSAPSNTTPIITPSSLFKKPF